MLAIIRRSSFFYATHFLTYVLLSLVEAVAGRRGIAAYIAAMAFIWLPSSVLWSERNESYSFLRLLPVRDRDVVRAKLLLGLGAAVVYWLWLSLLALAAWGATPGFFARFSLITLVASFWPPLVALCYLGIWLRGARAMTFPLLTLMTVVFIGVVGCGVKFLTPWRDDMFWRRLSLPWPLLLLLPAAGLALFLLLARLAPRIKWRNDEHLQLP
jgi:hypothetical protein